MSAVLEAKTSMRQLAVKAKETVGHESMTTAEKKTVLDQIQTDMKAFSETIALHEQAEQLINGGESAPEAKSADSENALVEVKGIGQQIVESKSYQAIQGIYASGRKKYTETIELKTVNTIDEGTTFANGFPTGQGGAAVMPMYLPGIVDMRFRKLLIAQLFAQGATNSNQISYVKETAFQNSAAGVAEKGAKPRTDDTISRVVEQVGKIAHTMKETDELLQDAPAYSSFLQNRMVFGVQLKEDGDLLNATGYPSVNGLLNRTGLQTAIAPIGFGTGHSPVDVIDAVYNQITAIRFNAFVEPDSIVVNPVDWQHIRLAKDANNQYYGGGPFTGAYGNGGFSNVDALWGLRVVITPAIASGTMCVGGYQECGQIFRRQGITVEMTNSNEDDFLNNLVAIRAEERLALAVYRPGGFGTVTPTWS